MMTRHVPVILELSAVVVCAYSVGSRLCIIFYLPKHDVVVKSFYTMKITTARRCPGTHGGMTTTGDDGIR